MYDVRIDGFLYEVRLSFADASKMCRQARLYGFDAHLVKRVRH